MKFYNILNYLIKNLGIKFSNFYIYSIIVDTPITEPKTENFTIKVCKKEDLNLFGILKNKFQQDMNNDHILIGAFYERKLIGYTWISFKSIKVPEIERSIHFNGAYIWRLWIKRSCRQRGIGKKLILFALNYIININDNEVKVYTIVNSSNMPSINTFVSLNFFIVGKIKYSRIFSWKKYQEKIDDDFMIKE